MFYLPHTPPPSPYSYCFSLLLLLHIQVFFKVTRKPKPTKNSRRPYLNEIPAHFTHEIKTKGYDVIAVNLFSRKIMRSPAKRGVTGVPYTTCVPPHIRKHKLIMIPI